ncbi:acyltransferase [Chitinophaga agrisoli]|uniref:Acyltransferase n=1 Tax=Chitinophaga agrisoli TaxID=2607653 RepID=A0A5B2VT97_9BACT|nr:acyltransferase [Chitinophaga agrisoli]KAA2241369.1 acyltransferase [Chitinophaga agrisoli]
MHLSNGTLPETTHKKLAGLDHLRALAIILVFLCHYRMFGHPNWINDIGGFGWTGVDLFFVLSGYLIAGQLFNGIRQGKGVSLKEFYLKRFFRILPAYLVVLTLYFSIPAFKEREGLSALWKYLTFTQNFGLDLRQIHAFTHAWSLCIEEQFYLFFPLIILFFTRLKQPKWGFYLVLALILGGLAIRTYSWFHFVAPMQGQDGVGQLWFKWVYYPTYGRLDGLLTGIIIAGIFQFRPVVKERMTRHGNAVLLAGLALITVCYFMCNGNMISIETSIIGFPLLSIAYGVMVVAAVSPSCILYKINARVTGVIATLSYPIYLSHKAVVNLTQQWVAQWGMDIAPDGVVMFVICMITVVLAGAVLHWIVEKPFLRWRDKVLKRKVVPVAAEVSVGDNKIAV